MASLFQKIRTATLGNLHDLLDKVIDLNSVAAIKQHIRDLEEAKDDLAESAAVAKGRVRTLTNRGNTLQLQINSTNEDIDLVLGDADASNDHLAEPLMQKVMKLEEELETTKGELDTAQKTSAALGQASERLDAKHREMVSNVRRLEALERSTKAKEQAAEALKAAGAAGSSAESASVDNVTARLQARADVADAKFDDAMGGFNDTVGESLDQIRAKQRLAERRKQLEARKAGSAAE